MRNNPPRRQREVGGSAPGSPFTMQRQEWNKARPELVELFLKPLHALTERYDGKVLLGEISGDDALLRAAEYTYGGGLDMVYTFDLLSCPGTPKGIRDVVTRLERHIGDGWACWSLGNHDVRRAVSRWGGDDPPEGLRRLAPVLLGALRGTVCLYQGEELGLEEAELAFEQLRDPWGITFWPSFKGRDGCRTPMPWESLAAEAGFTTGAPWLPIPESHRRRAVDVQDPDPGSVLNITRAFLNWRRERQPLRTGALRFLRTGGDLLAFERSLNERLLCLFNLGGEPVRYRAAGPLLDAGFASDGVVIDRRRVDLPPFGFAFAHLA